MKANIKSEMHKYDSPTSIRMPKGLKVKLAKKAKSLDRSVSWVMIDAMRKYVA